MPLPIPENLFHSYLRRWNIFSAYQFDPEEFLLWVREGIVLLRHNIRSSKVQPGKQGSVTGFTGSIQLGITNKALAQVEYSHLAHALITAAPYFGTGHKVTFGLGQTRLGWEAAASRKKQPLNSTTAPAPEGTAARIAQLQPIFLASKKRQGGDRAAKTALLWATIIARQENGDTLQSISIDLELPYDSVKKYAQLARKYLITINQG